MLGQPYDAKVDLWSVGIILYGEYQIKGDDIFTVIVAFIYSLITIGLANVLLHTVITKVIF